MSDAASTPRTIPLKRKLLYSAIITFAVLFSLEIVARLIPIPVDKNRAVGTRKFIDWLSHLSLEDREPLPLYESDSNRIWRLAAGRTFESSNFHHAPDRERQPITITINKQGYRGPEFIANRNDDFTVLCMGDSNIFGYPLDDADVFPRRLEAVLQSGETDSVRVINGGIPGYTSEQGRIWFEQEFQDVPFDWLILSYINNDAWRQPHTDRDVIDGLQGTVNASPLGRLAGASGLVQWGRYFSRPQVPEKEFVARVSLEGFNENIEFFLQQASAKGACVLILDYCVYAEYQDYVIALQKHSSRDNVFYLQVPVLAMHAVQNDSFRTGREAELEAVQKRWTDANLNENPLLWLYAEMFPEHLNEVGTRWLADIVAKLIAEKVSADNSPQAPQPESTR